MGVAGLGRDRGQVFVGFADRKEALPIAVAAQRPGAVVNHGVPEELGDFPVIGIPGQLVPAGKAEDFRDLRVGMFAIELIASG